MWFWRDCLKSQRTPHFPRRYGYIKQGMEKRDEIHRGEQQGADNIFAGLYRGLRAGEFAVRIIDAFVDGLDISEFRHSMLNDIGRPPYNPRDLLKLSYTDISTAYA